MAKYFAVKSATVKTLVTVAPTVLAAITMSCRILRLELPKYNLPGPRTSCPRGTRDMRLGRGS